MSKLSTAMILAAGRGERMRPLTDSIPKPLIEVGNYRLIEYHLFALARAGFHSVVINVSYRGEQIVNFIGDGRRYGLSIVYSIEEGAPLETAGGISRALPLLDAEKFVVVNGDIWCDFDFGSLQLPASSTMHLVLVSNPDHHPSGDFSLEAALKAGQTGALFEKQPENENPLLRALTFAGIGAYRRSVFEQLPTERYPLAPLIRRDIAAERVTAERHDGGWIDVGTPQRLAEARTMVS